MITIQQHPADNGVGTCTATCTATGIAVASLDDLAVGELPEGALAVGQRIGRGLIVLATYNEVEALAVVVQRIREANHALDVLVVDDHSPDGTGALATCLAASDPHVHALHRFGPRGLAHAYRAGAAWAARRGYDFVIEMDADASYAPEELPFLIAALHEQAGGMVLGSRWLPGSFTLGVNARQRTASRLAAAVARRLLRAHLSDPYSGVCAYSIEAALPAGPAGAEVFDSASGYRYRLAHLLAASRSGTKLTEVPITYVARRRGLSKRGLRGLLERKRGSIGLAPALSGRKVRVAPGSPATSSPRSGEQLNAA